MKALPPRERQGVYRAICTVRSLSALRPEHVPDILLARVLRAGLQNGARVEGGAPCKLIVVRDPATRARVRSSRTTEVDLQAALDVCVVFDPPKIDGAVSQDGTSATAQALFACCAALQNLWLAARAEGLGVAAVEIRQPALLRQVLGIPAEVTPIAYVSIGYADGSGEPGDSAPSARREPIDLIYSDRWGLRLGEDGLARSLASSQRLF